MNSVILASKNSNQVRDAAAQTGHYKARKKAEERSVRGGDGDPEGEYPPHQPTLTLFRVQIHRYAG